MAEPGYRTPPGIELRPPLASDVPALAQLSLAAFGAGDDRGDAVVQQRMAALVRQADRCSVVAESARGRLVGMALSRRIGPIMLLAAAAVSSEHQGRGILRAMLSDWPAAQRGTTRLILSSTDPAAIRTYAGLGLPLIPTISAGGILRPGAVQAPAGAAELEPLEAADLLTRLGEAVRGAAYPRDDLEMLDAQGDRVHVAENARGGAAIVRGRGVIRLAVATDETAARDALRGALAAVPPGATVHLNHLRAGMDWAVQEARAAGLVFSPEGPVFADGPLSPLHLPNGTRA